MEKMIKGNEYNVAIGDFGFGNEYAPMIYKDDLEIMGKQAKIFLDKNNKPYAIYQENEIDWDLVDEMNEVLNNSIYYGSYSIN